MKLYFGLVRKNYELMIPSSPCKVTESHLVNHVFDVKADSKAQELKKINNKINKDKFSKSLSRWFKRFIQPWCRCWRCEMIPG